MLHLRQRLVEHPAVERLPLHVESLQPARELVRLRGLVGQQQPQSVGRVADSAGGIEPRTQDVAHVSGAQLAPAEPGGGDERAETRPPALRHQPESMSHQDPVLADQRHHVGHGGQRHQIE